VAQARRGNLDQNLTRSWSLEFDFFDDQRAALGIRSRLTLLIQNCGANLHPNLLDIL
jgi:hypothetical protein